VLAFLRSVPAAIFAAGIPCFAVAETITAVPEQPLQAVLDRAQDGASSSSHRANTGARSG